MTDTYTPPTGKQINVAFEIYSAYLRSRKTVASLDQVAAACEVIAFALAEYQRQQWQPLETAPKDGTHILICCKPDAVYECGRIGVDVWYHNRWLISTHPLEPIAWMPLPPPPEGER